MSKVLVLGAGGHALVVADALRASGHEVVGFLDDHDELHGSFIMGLPVLGPLRLALERDDLLVMAIGDNATRKRVVQELNEPDERYIAAIHSSAIMGWGVQVASGAMVLGGVVLNPETHIGRHAIVNTSSSIDHHGVIGPYAHIAPGCHLAGHVTVEEGAFLGVGVSVVPGVTIGAWAVVGAGAVVLYNVPPGAVVVGVPARAMINKGD
jgi:sugar O-acyltransferase (sialic acid O-acetyltransferase NeuD family)